MAPSRALAVTTTALVAAALTAAPVTASAQGAPTFGPSSSPSSSPSPSPSPSPSLPRVTDTLDPALSIGGPRLAQMNSVIVDTPAGVPAPPAVSDVAWVVADADTGEILAAKNPHAHLLPASTLKTLTAIHLLPRISPTAVLTATRAEADADGTRVGMVAGATYTAQQLFQGLVMSSGNDAAYGLAALNGGLPKTVTELGALADELGAHDTVVVDPSGLDAPGQRSSAYDLALFGRAAISLPAYARLATTKTATFPSVPTRTSRARGTFVIGNHNRLLWNYPGTIGVKNGFTKAAHRTFIGAARRGERTYIVTEMYGTGSSWRPAASLLDWAFAHGDMARPVGRLVERGEVTEPPVAREEKPAADAPSDAGSSAAAGPGANLPTIPDESTAPSAAAPRTSDGDVTSSRAPWVGGAALTLLVLAAGASRVSRRRRRALTGRQR